MPPLFVVRGNHEGDPGLFEKKVGPLHFTLESNRLGFKLAAVDNSGYELSPGEISFLKTNLEPSYRNLFVTMHIPPKTERWPKHTFENGKDELLRLMVERKVAMGLFAHIHLFDKEMINGIPCVISGGAGARLTVFGYKGDAEYHIVIVEVKNGKVSYRTERF